MRCDGNARCSTCVLYEEDCIYEPDLDGRKPATKMFVEALQNRIKVLEEMLGDQESGDGADNDNSSVDQVPPVRPDQSPASQKVSGSLIVSLRWRFNPWRELRIGGQRISGSSRTDVGLHASARAVKLRGDWTHPEWSNVCLVYRSFGARLGSSSAAGGRSHV